MLLGLACIAGVGAGAYYATAWWLGSGNAFSTRLLTTIPADLDEPKGGWHLRFSVVDVVKGTALANHARVEVGYRGLRNGRAIVRQGDQEWGPYDVPRDYYRQMTFSPDGRRFAFIAQRGNQMFFVVDGEEHPPFDEVTFYPGFNALGTHFLYRADVRHALGKKTVAVIDGVPTSEFDYVWGLGYTPDGRTPAYVGEVGREKHLQLGGAPQEQRNNDVVYLSADGSRTARLLIEDSKWTVVVGEERSRSFGFIEEESFAVSRDRKTLGFLASDADLSSFAALERTPKQVVVSGQVVVADTTIAWRHLAVGNDGKSIAYARRAGPGRINVLRRFGYEPEQQVGPSACSISDLQFIGDNRLAFIGVFPRAGGPPIGTERGDTLCYGAPGEQQPGSMGLIIGGSAEPRYPKIEPLSLIFTEDGRRHAYAAERDGRDIVVIDGRESEPMTLSAWPVFSPDGRHIAYVAKDGTGEARRDRLIVNGKATPIDGISEGGPVFSTDGRNVGLGVRKNRELWWRVWSTTGQ